MLKIGPAESKQIVIMMISSVERDLDMHLTNKIFSDSSRRAESERKKGS